VGALDEFEALADAAEDHRVLADDVAGANSLDELELSTCLLRSWQLRYHLWRIFVDL
jgi:hypothetical protein